MRVLITTDTVGGVWTFTQELAGGLLKQGCSVALVSFGRKPSALQQRWCDGVKEQWGEAFVYEASDVPLEWMENNSAAFEAGAPVLMRVANAFGAELIHSNQLCFGALTFPVPKIVTAHSDVLSWAEACHAGGLEDSYWLQCYRSLVSAGLCGADCVVAPTQWMLQALERNFDLCEERLVIPNGRAVRPVQRARKLQAVTAGRLWDEAKNVRMLAEVSAPFPLLLAGETRYETAGSDGQLGAVQLLGALSSEEMVELLSESSVYVCPSLYEPFGLAPLEAALCGCAVLANDLPSLREVWGDGALYFRDAASLSGLLQELNDDPERLGAAQRRSTERAKEFSVDQMVESYLNLFVSALKHGEAARYVA